MTIRHSAYLILLCLAACARTAAPPLPTRAVVAPPAKPTWVARKVVADAVDVAPASVTVAAGETLSAIATRARLPLGAVVAANDGTAVYAGQTVKLPGGRVHVVKRGETGIAIARAYGVEWQRVVTANRLRAPYVLEVGDRLLLPSIRQVAAMTLEQRAAAFRIDIDDLITGAEPAAAAPEVARATPPAQKPLPALAGATPRFDWPLSGRIVSGFGAKPGGRFNDGVNLDATAGEAVRAAADGIVAYAGNAVAGFGNLILVKHADGWVSAYAHNAALLVARGRKVARGEAIARAGATGAVTAPQLHFELRRGRAAVDPLKHLPARG